jgi:hypothetical protein
MTKNDQKDTQKNSRNFNKIQSMKRLAIRHGTVRAWLKATQDLHSRDASMLCWIPRKCLWNCGETGKKTGLK